MAFNAGVTDIAAAIRIAFTIYEYGFNEDNAADVRYREFQNDIRNFGVLLKRLERSVRDAQHRFVEAGLQARARGAYDPSALDLTAEREVLIGNFNDTLESCDAILVEHIRFRDRHATAFESILWHVKQRESQMDNLRRRIRFHSDRIRLVIDRLSIGLLTRIDARLDELVGTTEEILMVSQDNNDELRRLRQFLMGDGNAPEGPPAIDVHYATPAIAQRFEATLATNAPCDIFDGIPLVNSFDALHSLFDECVATPAKDPHKYLLLLKCRWLISHIRRSEDYLETIFYRHAINRIEQGIRLRIRHGHVRAFDERIMLALPGQWFEVWPRRPPVEPAISSIPPEPDPLSPRANEEGVVRIELAGDETSPASYVTVYQNSDEDFRIVKETWTATGKQVIAPQQVYALEDALIPRYAMPTLPTSAPEMSIFCRKTITDFLFRDEADMWKFQAALTGYDVSHNQRNVLCQFGPSLDSFVCEGTAQVWQDRIIFEDDPNGSSFPAPVSPESAGDNDVSASRSRRPSFAPSIARTNTILTTPEGWIGDNIKLAKILIFTQFEEGKNKGRFAIIYIELIEGLNIDRTKCRCKEDYELCSKLVITGGSKRPVPVRIAVSELDAGGNPNPNTFDLLPFRRPRRPEYSRIKVRETEHIVLKFPDLEAKRAFHKDLAYRFALRDKQRSNATAATNAFIHRSNKPLRKDEYISQGVSRRTSTTSVTSGRCPQVTRPQALPPHQEVQEDAIEQLEAVNGTETWIMGARPIPIRTNGTALLSRSSDFSHAVADSQSMSTSFNSSTRGNLSPTMSASPRTRTSFPSSSTSPSSTGPIRPVPGAGPVRRPSGAQHNVDTGANGTATTPSPIRHNSGAPSNWHQRRPTNTSEATASSNTLRRHVSAANGDDEIQIERPAERRRNTNGSERSVVGGIRSLWRQM